MLFLRTVSLMLDLKPELMIVGTVEGLTMALVRFILFLSV